MCNDCQTVWADENLLQITNRKNVIVPALGGEVVHVDAVAPGCENEGNIEHWYCETCEQVWQDEALTQLTNHKNVKLPVTHNDIIHVDAVAPGCENEGNIEYWYCGDCNMVWADEALTQLTNHKNVKLPVTHNDIIHVEAKAPTCKAGGNVEYWYCGDCNMVWADEALLQITNHMNVKLGTVDHKDENADYKCDFDCGTVVAPAADSTLTIEQAVALGQAVGSGKSTDGKYYITGTITGFYSYSGSESYGNVYIEDDNGDSILVYGIYSEDGKIGYSLLNGKPLVGDTITVYGIINNFNGTSQLKSGWLQDLVVNHTHDWADADCYNPKTCSLCNLTDGEELGHNYVDGVCDRAGCGAIKPAEGSVTVSFTAAEVAEANGWVNQTKYSSVTVDGVLFTAAGTDSNTGKYYTKAPGSWRFYSSGNATLTIKAPEGKNISSVALTWSEGGCSYNDTAMASGVAITVSGNEIVISFTAKTFVNAIEVVYA